MTGLHRAALGAALALAIPATAAPAAAQTAPPGSRPGAGATVTESTTARRGTPATASEEAFAAGPTGAATGGAATVTEITPSDLRARVGIFAADSMEGREAGTPGHERAAAYIAAELARLGLEPAGEDGTFFQTVPLVRRVLDPASAIRFAGEALDPNADWAPLDHGRPVRPAGQTAAVFGGFLDDPAGFISAEQAAGKFVVLAARPGGPGMVPFPGPSSPFHGAAAVAVVGDDRDLAADWIRRPRVALPGPDADAAPAVLLLRRDAARRLFGAPVDSLSPGAGGGAIEARIAFLEEPAPSPNVVAILPGSDPALSGQYVALGAHSDHDGLSASPVDHDSVRAYNRLVRERRAAKGEPLTPLERAELRVEAGALRGDAPRRADSVFNGADDDASGSMALLEVAERFAAGERPRRSLLFVWHTAEEKGLIGARWYTDHPTVPRDSIVAQVNLDMIARNAPAGFAEGGPGYLQLIGSRRLSTELGDLVEALNAGRPRPFAFDYTFDAPGHPQNYYCRSDHYMYARWGIPVVFFSTGDHVDYHQVTDEPAYLDWDHYAEVTRFVAEVAGALASLDRAPAVDGPKPDPHGRCRQ